MMRTVIGVLLGVLLLGVPPVASAQSEQVYYYYTDATGSVRMITDATGQAVEWHDYQPFGEESLINPQTPERRLYTGKERDSETNYDYSMARYYAGINGRFTTVDPGHVAGDIFDPQTWNGYSYALNNPLRYVDPDGYLPIGIECPGGIMTDDGCISSSDFQFAQTSGQLASSTGPSVTAGDAQSWSASNTPQTPWDKTCIAKAVGIGLLHVGIDAIGLFPEGSLVSSGVSRAVGNFARVAGGTGWRGIVATQQGTKLIHTVHMSAAIGLTGFGANDTSAIGSISTSLGTGDVLADLLGASPGVGQFLAGLSIGLDLIHTGVAVRECR